MKWLFLLGLACTLFACKSEEDKILDEIEQNQRKMEDNTRVTKSLWELSEAQRAAGTVKVDTANIELMIKIKTEDDSLRKVNDRLYKRLNQLEKK